MSYALTDLPIYKSRNLNLARNIFGLLAIFGVAAMIYLVYGKLAYAIASALVLPVVGATAIGMIGCWLCNDYTATLRIDQWGFYYSGNMGSCVCSWGEIASVDTTRILVSRTVYRTAIRINLKANSGRKPKSLVFVYAFGVANDLIPFLRECTAQFGDTNDVDNLSSPTAVPARTHDESLHFGKRRPIE